MNPLSPFGSLTTNVKHVHAQTTHLKTSFGDSCRLCSCSQHIGFCWYIGRRAYPENGGKEAWGAKMRRTKTGEGEVRGSLAGTVHQVKLAGMFVHNSLHNGILPDLVYCVRN